MSEHFFRPAGNDIATLDELARLADYSMMGRLNCDPEADPKGNDHDPREVMRGHYVTVRPTPIEAPEYVAHSEPLFRELGLADSLAQSPDFMRVFSGDLAQVPSPMRTVGWACGYALSIYGTEYTQQCPFRTGNGYGDGRAISVFEAVLGGSRREMQLKGGGRTPYCRGADGRAVLRSSVREFLAQEHMHALGVPTSRSLSLYVSKTETVMRPWYAEGSCSRDPDRLISEPVAISTRVASSFIRVGQLELFGRRVRKQAHHGAMQELERLVLHLIDREYGESIDPHLDLPTKVVLLAQEFRSRLVCLVANWIRVGYCQGNFNSDNCAAGGFTLDYGPFGFCDVFDPAYQPWTGGGDHFAFLNQPVAAQRNFQMFCVALQPLLGNHRDHRARLEEIQQDFPKMMRDEMESMWAAKLGLEAFDANLVSELLILMRQTPVDYTLFFRELSALPDDIGALQKAFYRLPQAPSTGDAEAMDRRWSTWLTRWRSCLGIGETNRGDEAQLQRREACSRRMKRVNPKYTLREWLMVPVCQQAAQGNYAPLRELQAIMALPYDEQSCEVEQRFYRQKPLALFALGGVSHYSCSS